MKVKSEQGGAEMPNVTQMRQGGREKEVQGRNVFPSTVALSKLLVIGSG